jgi:hypothetical protein
MSILTNASWGPNAQRNRPTGPKNWDEEGPVDAAKAIAQAYVQQELYQLQGIWYERNHQEVGGVDIPITAGEYAPPFRVRAMSVTAEAAGATALFYRVNYDLPLSMDCVDDFAVGADRILWVTRVRLSAKTTATRIILKG